MPVEGTAFSVWQRPISNSLFLESGNMIIMALSYAQKTGDKTHLTQYVSNQLFLSYLSKYLSLQTALLDQWTQFLITDSLIPGDQLSTDDFAGHLVNQTNLAIKGIVGIKAMSQIASLVGDTAKSANYSVCGYSHRVSN